MPWSWSSSAPRSAWMLGCSHCLGSCSSARHAALSSQPEVVVLFARHAALINGDRVAIFLRVAQRLLRRLERVVLFGAARSAHTALDPHGHRSRAVVIFARHAALTVHRSCVVLFGASRSAYTWVGTCRDLRRVTRRSLNATYIRHGVFARRRLEWLWTSEVRGSRDLWRVTQRSHSSRPLGTSTVSSVVIFARHAALVSGTGSQRSCRALWRGTQRSSTSCQRTGCGPKVSCHA